MMPAHRFRWLAITIAAAASAAIVLLVALQYAPALTSARQPAEATTPSPASGLPELSLFDQPRKVPEIRFSDAENRALTLADFRGKVVLLNIWATWCVPCRGEMPALDRLQAKLGGNAFVVLPLSIDRTGLPAVKRFYSALGLRKLGIYLDPSAAASRALDIPGVPTTLLIDRTGREAARKMGPAEWDAPETVALIRRLTDAQPVSDKGPRP